MYKIFKLPHDFLNRDYTDQEKEEFDAAISEYVSGARQPITEALTPKQMQMIDRNDWQSPVIKKMHDQVFGKDNDRIILPYDNSLDKPITTNNYDSSTTVRGQVVYHPTIISILKQHNYHTDDYAAGLAYHVDSPLRKLKIHSILSTIGVADKLSGFHSKETKFKKSRPLTYGEVFAADPIRAAAKKEKQVVITRNKYDVAGMSTDRGWQSCMNLVSGSNKHYVLRDITQGTLTAYLCHKDDDNIIKPIGRMNIKRFDNISGSNDIAFVPENATYGTTTDQFKKIVTDFVEKNYPMKDAGVYQKHSSLYNDDGVNIKFHKLDEIDPEKELHRATDLYLDTTLQNHFDEDNHPSDEWVERDSVGDATSYYMDKYHAKLDDKRYAHSLVHWISDHSYDKDGHAPKELDDLDEYDIRTSNPIQSWATNEIDSTVGKRRFNRGITDFSPTDTTIALEKIHKGMNSTPEEDHEHLKYIHGAIIDHAFSNNTNEWKQVQEHIVHHAFDQRYSDYYHENHRGTVKDNSDVLQKRYFATLSTNPRTIHTILNYETDRLNPNKDGLSTDNFDTISHIANHADTKLTHHMYVENNGMYDWNKVKRFTESMNDNPNSESIQHDLISQMHLYTDDDEYSDRNKLMFEAIAGLTKHKSVYDRIASRLDTDLNDSDIRKAHSNNQNFKYLNPNHSTFMESYLKYLKK